MNITIIGSGKMGAEVARLATEKGYGVVAFVSADLSRDEKMTLLQRADAAIEFTRPEAAYENIKLCLDAGVPIVSGTTGWLSDLQTAKAYCELKKGSFLHASNFSIGVHVFFEINRRLASIMKKVPAYEVTLEEIHHTAKLDMPSGTAIVLADDILSSIGRKNSWSLNPKPPFGADVLPLTAQRLKDVPGTHRVTYTSDADEITIVHEAKSRSGFAEGALMAASWIRNRKGFFTMKDVLNDILFDSDERRENK
jgi:4-hydroxy-tetrahydrodipicolinate reductase